MYADDKTLFQIGPSVDVVCDALNRVLGGVHNWCRNNKLAIHSGKSEVMVLNRNSFCGPLKPVILGDKILSYVNSSVCLGVVIDSKLSWQPQITAVCKSFSRKVDSRTSTITHFVEHSTRLYDCKSYILNSIYKLVTENDFVLVHINYHLFSCRQLNDNELKTLPSGIFSDLSSLRYL